MSRTRSLLSFAAVLLGAVAFAQSSVGALGKSSDAAQRVFDGRAQLPSDTIYELAAVEVQPQYPGGDSAMYSYLASTIKYPEEEADMKISGKVFVEFVVRKDGQVDQVKVLRGVSPGLDAESVRVLYSMPRWTPAVMRGKAVATRYLLPINFVID